MSASVTEFRFRLCEDREKFLIELRPPGSERWRVAGRFSTLDSMLKHALRKGVAPGEAKEMMASLQAAEARVVEALRVAIEDGSLVLPAAGSRRAEGGSVRTRRGRTAGAGSPGAV